MDNFKSAEIMALFDIRGALQRLIRQKHHHEEIMNQFANIRELDIFEESPGSPELEIGENSILFDDENTSLHSQFQTYFQSLTIRGNLPPTRIRGGYNPSSRTSGTSYSSMSSVPQYLRSGLRRSRRGRERRNHRAHPYILH